MAENKPFKKRDLRALKKTIRLIILHYCICDTQCTAVFYNDWSLQMGPKMTLGTLIMSGDDFPGV